MKKLFVYLFVSLLLINFIYAKPVMVSNEKVTLISESDFVCAEDCLSYVYITYNDEIKDVIDSRTNTLTSLNYYTDYYKLSTKQEVNKIIVDNKELNYKEYNKYNTYSKVVDSKRIKEDYGFKILPYSQKCEDSYIEYYDRYNKKYVRESNKLDCYKKLQPINDSYFNDKTGMMLM